MKTITVPSYTTSGKPVRCALTGEHVHETCVEGTTLYDWAKADGRLTRTG